MRVQEPTGDGPAPAILMLHGWTGDENSMWVFATRLPRHAVLIAPRGLYPAPLGGYGWHATHNRIWPALDDFHPAIERLLELLVKLRISKSDLAQFSVVGFSQGAALAYALALLHPDRVTAVAALAGFMPSEIEPSLLHQSMNGKPVFVTHGTQDELVPVGRARAAVDALQRAGAQVTYCEDDVGHKLSLNCFRGLQAFFTGVSN